MTQRSLSLVEYFWFYEQFKIHCHFQNLSLFLSWETEIYASIDFHKQIPGQDWACLFLYCPQTKACNPGKCLGDCFYCYYSFSLVCGLQVDAWSWQKNLDDCFAFCRCCCVNEVIGSVSQVKWQTILNVCVGVHVIVLPKELLHHPNSFATNTHQPCSPHTKEK